MNKPTLVHWQQLKFGDKIKMNNNEYYFIDVKTSQNPKKIILQGIESGLIFNGNIFDNDLCEIVSKKRLLDRLINWIKKK